MGLLEKALHGVTTIPPSPPHAGARGGFFAKAAAAHEHQGDTVVSTPKASSPPFLSRAESEKLAAELRSIPEKADSILHVFGAIAKYPHCSSIALLLPRGEEFAVAASRGLSISEGSTLPASLVVELGNAPRASDSPSLAHLKELFTIPSSATVRCSAVGTEAHASPKALFVYTTGESGSPPREEYLDALLRAPSVARTPPLLIVEACREPSAQLFDVIPPDRHGAAMLFFLDPLYERARCSIPGLVADAFASAAVSAASALLGSQGSALWFDRPDRRLGLVLIASSPLDPELTLFQFTKSFSRSLVSFDSGEKPSGESCSINPSEPYAAEALGHFLAG